MKRTAVVCGGGGFIGSHLVRDLAERGYWVRAVDVKKPAYSKSRADEFVVGDLRRPAVARRAVAGVGEVYQLAADMGGMGYIDGEHDAAIMHNSTMINLNVLEAARNEGGQTLFYASSACVYSRQNQDVPDDPLCREDTVYPAEPDGEYGWEKLYGERLFATYGRVGEVAVKIARLHNIFGPEGTWRGGREKAPAALCRKVAKAADGGVVEVWGDGQQTRSFLYIEECLEGIRRLMASDWGGPVNIGSDEMLSINDFVYLIAEVAGKRIRIKNIPGAVGVRGRTSDNTLIYEKLGWRPTAELRDGLTVTYRWIAEQVARQRELGEWAESGATAGAASSFGSGDG